ncbi:MAG: hypothetical protein QF685_04615 [Verrucomicrobiota bacterium]|nr:hypothetical protein [Verrucomicrobiota bacterium]
MTQRLAIILSALLLATHVLAEPTLIVVMGAPGEEEYTRQFKKWTGQWGEAAQKAKATLHTIGIEDKKSSDKPDKDQLKKLIEAQPRDDAEPLWLVLIGHGTYDGKTAKFNLRGPDLSASELTEWLKNHERPLAIINCASSSGPFVAALSGPNRTIATATRSGFEQNFTRLGGHLATALTDPTADLDKDQQVSLLEAFLTAAHRTAEFYKVEGRLATEHPLIDDNADGRGTPTDWFRGIRVTKQPEDNSLPDGLRAHQLHLVLSGSEQQLPPETRTRRNALELQLAEIRTQKPVLKEDEYYNKLEPLLLELARLYQQRPGTNNPEP